MIRRRESRLLECALLLLCGCCLVGYLPVAGAEPPPADLTFPSDESEKPEQGQRCLEHAPLDRERPVLVVTSFGTKSLHVVGKSNNILADRPTAPFWVFHDDSFEQRVLGKAPRDGVAAKVPERFGGFMDTICLVDLFEAAPWLWRETLDESSGLNRFYTFAGRWEPYAHPIGFKVNTLLLRKMAAIRYALSVVPRHTVVVWADSDVAFQKPLSAPMYNWLAEHDLNYIPFFLKGKHEPPLLHPPKSDPLYLERCVFYDSEWRVESGVMAATATSATRSLFNQAVHMYRGGMLELAQSCFMSPSHPGHPHSHSHIKEGDEIVNPLCHLPHLWRNMYLNDIFVLSLLLQLQVHNTLPELTRGFEQLRHGWLPTGHKECEGHGFTPEEVSVWEMYRQPNFCPPVQGEEHESTLIAPEPIFRYFMHFMGSSGALRLRLYQRDKVDKAGHVVESPHPPYLQFSAEEMAGTAERSLFHKLEAGMQPAGENERMHCNASSGVGGAHLLA